MTRALLLPSPFLSADTTAPLADALGRHGWGAVVAAPPRVPADADELLAAFAADADRVRPDVVLAHSNAGRHAAWVAPAGAVLAYVDAALPPPAGEAPMAPEALLDHLAGTADGSGLLPPWTRWWSEEDIAEVLPDPGLLARVRAGEPRVPLSYVRSRLAAPPGWAQRPSCYLAFGGTYAEEVALARDAGWPTAVLEGAGHLHHLVDPGVVADAVVELVGRVVAALGARRDPDPATP